MLNVISAKKTYDLFPSIDDLNDLLEVNNRHLEKSLADFAEVFNFSLPVVTRVFLEATR
jgi:AraC-like DNA-binding protein